MTQTTASAPSRPPPGEYQDADSFEVAANGHTFTFYPRGSERLDALVDHIDQAQESLSAFYYTFLADASGERVRDAFVRAARRGVAVHLIIDDFGSDPQAEFFEPIEAAGGQFNVFSARWNVRYLIRNHQKFVIADNARVMTGGNNVSDEYFDPPSQNGWCDLGVAIEGEVVERFTEWFGLLRDWTTGSGSQLRRIRRMVKQWDGGEGPVQLLVSGPLVRRKHWAFHFKRDLMRAQRLDTVSAYFSPPRSIRRLMKRIGQRGGARMVMAGKSDIDATIDIARLLYKRLLRAGVRIFEFLPCKLHMKLLIVDDVSYFGSANLDKRSVRINVELMVRVEDEALAARLREFVDGLETASQPVTPEYYARETGFFTRMRWRFFYFLSLADYRVARGLNG